MPLISARFRYLLLCLFVVVLPLEVLFDTTNAFYYDWMNHVWLVSYYSDFLRAHWQLPDVVHATQIVGFTQTMFYGHVFYALTGLIGALVGPDLAVRILFFALLSGQFYLMLRLFEAYSSNRTFSVVIATLVTWSTYPLTNLYNRGAVTEFVAVCLLHMSLCSLLLALAQTRTRAIVLTVLASILFFTLAALTHPITGLIGGLSLLLLFGFVVVVHPSSARVVQASVGGGVLALAAFSPWLYALFLFQGDLPIDAPTPLVTYPLDTFLGRISPTPFDIRSLMSGRGVATPYLDAQISMTFVPLLIATWWAARTSKKDDSSSPFFRRSVMSPATARILAVVAAVVFVYGFTISLGWLPGFVPAFIARAQFGYRLITYLNVCLLLLALAATQYYSGRRLKKDVMLVGMTAAISLSLTAVIVKLTHSHVVREGAGPWRFEKDSVSVPPTLYSLGDYNIVAGLTASPPATDELELTFKPPVGKDFATLAPMAFHLDRETLVKTNVSSFPWNQVLLDSREVPRHYYRANMPFARDVFLSSFVAPAGDHTLEYRFVPDWTWRVCRAVSLLVLAGWAIGLCGMQMRAADPSNAAAS